MTLRCVLALSLAALSVSGGAKADGPPSQTAVNTIVRTAAVTGEIAQLASNAIVVPAIAETAVPAEVAMPLPAPEERAAGSVAAAAAAATRQRHGKGRLAEKSGKRRHDNGSEAEAICVRAIGKAETGTAAWYGGRYVGRRTSSGSRLDAVHPTAAHRTLPLNSLARVTNLDNGRSVVVRVTDRGPVSASLLIDMSPRAAEELRMKHAGLIPVSVEQVVEVPPDSK